MTLRHTLLFSVLALAGGFIGGQMGRPIQANAQIPPPRSENQVLVPTDGLRFVTENQQTIAVLANQGGNAVFALLDSSGRPAIAFSAGPGGSVTVRAQADGGTLELGTPDGKNRTRISATGSGSVYEATAGSATLLLANRGGTSTLNMPMPNGRSALEILTSGAGVQLDLRGSNGSSAFTASSTASGGLLAVKDLAGTTTATISSAGQFSSIKSGRTVWTAPSQPGN